MHQIDMTTPRDEQQAALETAEHAVLGLVMAMERAGFSNDPERLVAGAVVRVLGAFYANHIDARRVMEILKAMH